MALRDELDQVIEDVLALQNGQELWFDSLEDITGSKRRVIERFLNRGERLELRLRDNPRHAGYAVALVNGARPVEELKGYKYPLPKVEG